MRRAALGTHGVAGQRRRPRSASPKNKVGGDQLTWAFLSLPRARRRVDEMRTFATAMRGNTRSPAAGGLVDAMNDMLAGRAIFRELTRARATARNYRDRAFITTANARQRLLVDRRPFTSCIDKPLYHDDDAKTLDDESQDIIARPSTFC